MGPTAGVSAGHPLTSAAAFTILLKGGNAFDAGVAALLAGGVVEQDLYSLGGEALVLVYPKSERKVTAVVGQGWAPAAVDVDWYLSRQKTLKGEGLDPAVTPGALHAALTVLEKWGTRSFEEVATPAIDYAEKGFPVRTSTVRAIQNQQLLFAKWPDNYKFWSKPDGSQYVAGETVKLPNLARTLRRMVEAERKAKKKGRRAGIVAARDRFYKGDIARDMVAFLKKNEAPFEYKDFAEFFARVEEPAHTTYRGYTVYKHGFGSQGPMLLQTLNILETFDLRAMGYGSADYLHTVTEAMKLAYADRDTYYADPTFVKVPAEGLLSKEYAKERAALIDPAHALKTFVAGDPLKYDTQVKAWPFWKADVRDTTQTTTGDQSASAQWLADRRDSVGQDSSGIMKDTTHVAVVDKDGNLFDCTPSGGWINGAVILGDTGIGMSIRGEQFFLDTTRANQIRPHARPRYTLTPSLVFKGDAPLMAHRHARRRQSGSDHPPGHPRHRRILGRLVSQPPRRARTPARADGPFPRLVLAAHARVQHARRRSRDPGRRVSGVAEARPRRQPSAHVRHVRLRHRRHDRSRDGQSLRRPAIRAASATRSPTSAHSRKRSCIGGIGIALRAERERARS